MHLGGYIVKEAGYRKALRHKEEGKEGAEKRQMKSYDNNLTLCINQCLLIITCVT